MEWIERMARDQRQKEGNSENLCRVLTQDREEGEREGSLEG